MLQMQYNTSWPLMFHKVQLPVGEPSVQTSLRHHNKWKRLHYNDVIMSEMAPQITGVSIVFSTADSGADQRKHQISASLAFLRGITGTGEFPAQKASNVKKCFHLMTSSWICNLEVIRRHKRPIWEVYAYLHTAIGNASWVLINVGTYYDSA